MLLRRHSAFIRATALTALLSLVACQHYVPTTIEQTERPDRVRVHLSRPVSVELLDLTAHNATVIDGEVVSWSDDQLILSVWWIEAGGQSEYRGQGETAVIPRSDIASIESREISLVNTLMLAGVVVLTIVLGAGALAEVAGSSDDGGDGVER
jgi:hypothetical protein